MNPRQNAIKAMQKFHEDFKQGKNDSEIIEESFKALDDSERNFMLLNGKMKNFEDLYPVQDKLSNQYSLADLVTAYHYYYEEDNSSKENRPLMIKIDNFYK